MDRFRQKGTGIAKPLSASKISGFSSIAHQGRHTGQDIFFMIINMQYRIKKMHLNLGNQNLRLNFESVEGR